MAEKITLNVPLNRVEGDLEVRISVSHGIVDDAWSSGTMFRGFEKILVGRGSLDGLVITPRICGICSISHLTAAAKALDMIAKVTIPADGERVRNICSMIEHIQSDMRHYFLMFAPDYVNPAYQSHSLYPEAQRRYEPLAGQAVIEIISETKRLLEIIAIFGGQWPHTSFIVPGGVVSLPNRNDISQSRQTLSRFRHWYERRVLGCSIERWRAVESAADLEKWLHESEAHAESDLGFFIRFSRSAGFHTLGKGHGNFLSVGGFPLPPDSAVVGMAGGGNFIPAGFISSSGHKEFLQDSIAEDPSHSWFREDDGGPKHPFEGTTVPYATGKESRKYSWAKAPRYAGHPAETSPLAEMMVADNPLFSELVDGSGPSVFTRELARLTRPAWFLPAIDTWLTEIDPVKDRFYTRGAQVLDGEGYGLIQAARGALGHWVKIKAGRITHYQIITPTAWHGSPRDLEGKRGPWEEAVVGTPVADIENPIEVAHVIRSFDPCLVCAVHAIRRA